MIVCESGRLLEPNYAYPPWVEWEWGNGSLGNSRMGTGYVGITGFTYREEMV